MREAGALRNEDRLGADLPSPQAPALTLPAPPAIAGPRPAQAGERESPEGVRPWTTTGLRSTMLRSTLAWLGTLAVYLLLAGGAGIHEVATGIGVASLTTAWAGRIRTHATRHFRFSRVHFAPWGRALAGLGSATLRTGVALVRAILVGTHPGHAHRRPFRRGPEDEPAERARRAGAVLLASLAPDSFVLRADPGRDEALIHAFGETPPPADPQWLA